MVSNYAERELHSDQDVHSGFLIMKQVANYMPEPYEKMDRSIPKYYDYLRDSVMQVGSEERQIIGNSSKNFFSVGKTCRPLRNRICNQVLRESAAQTTGKIVKNRIPHHGAIRSIFSFEFGFVDFAKADMLI